MISERSQYGLAFLGCVALIAGALVFENIFDLDPCPLCMIQRILIIALGLVFAVAFVHTPKVIGRRVYGTLTALVASLGVAVAGRHVWLQNLPEGQVPECGPGLDYILSVFPLGKAVDIILRGSGECHEIQWSFLGLTIPGWTLTAFALFAMFGYWQITRSEAASAK